MDYRVESAAVAVGSMTDAEFETFIAKQRALRPAMSSECAVEINSRIVCAWMIRDGLTPGPVPSLSDVSLDDAVAASRIVAATPAKREADGRRTFTCHVEPSRIPALYAWAVSQPNGNQHVDADESRAAPVA